MDGRILIVDDMVTNRIVLKVKLAAACYETMQASTGAEALKLARAERPGAILLDMTLPDISGIDLCRALRQDPRTRQVPIIALTASVDADLRIAMLKAGADDVLSKPFDELILLARLRSLLRARAAMEELRVGGMEGTFGMAEAAEGFEGAARIAVVTARPDSGLALRRILGTRMPGANLRLMTRADALGAEATVDLYLIEADLDREAEGLRLLTDLRSRPTTRDAAICILAPAEARETRAMAYDLGAGDVMAPDAAEAEISLRLHDQLRRKRQADRLRASVRDGLRLAVTDALTGLHNRRYALPELSRIAAAMTAGGGCYAVMVLDIDRFKAVNDTWGHAAGDAVLAELARRLREVVRSGDLLARIGGEEFLVVMPDTTLGAARQAAERICRVTGERPVMLPGGMGDLNVTLSIGLALGSGAQREETRDVLERADQALLLAKSEGRNQVTVGRSAA